MVCLAAASIKFISHYRIDGAYDYKTKSKRKRAEGGVNGCKVYVAAPLSA